MHQSVQKRNNWLGKLWLVFFDYFEDVRTITGAVLFNRLIDGVRRTRLHLKKKKFLFHYDNAPSHTSNIAQAKSMNWVSIHFHIHRILQTWAPATIICSQTSRNGCVVCVLSRTKKSSGKEKGILEGLTNRTT